MRQDPEAIPVACRLSAPELRAREASLLARFRSAVIRTEELQEGYTFRLPGEGESIRLVAELIAAERECCPFLTFELSAEPNRGPLRLRVSGPGGTKEFLKALIGIGL